MTIFSSFDKIFPLTGFVFDIDDFHFRVHGKMGNAFPRAFWEFRQLIQKIDRLSKILLYSNFQNHKKSEEHFPSGHKYVTN